jgi:hypothetical protein
MKTLLTILTTVSALALGTAAYAADPSDGPDSKTTYTSKDNGGYKVDAKSSETTAAGTDKSAEVKTDVTVKDNGDTTTTSEKDVKSDAKGLMNSKKEVSKEKTKAKADGSRWAKKTHKSTNAAGTDVSSTTQAKTKIDANGNAVTTTETKDVTDPKGLMNKEEVETKTKAVNGEVTEQSKDND